MKDGTLYILYQILVNKCISGGVFTDTYPFVKKYICVVMGENEMLTDISISNYFVIFSQCQKLYKLIINSLICRFRLMLSVFMPE